jgi:hypothetical protein
VYSVFLETNLKADAEGETLLIGKAVFESFTGQRGGDINLKHTKIQHDTGAPDSGKPLSRLGLKPRGFLVAPPAQPHSGKPCARLE